jgi:alpha-tubulin suppressor-like RCC1 family protein
MKKPLLILAGLVSLVFSETTAQDFSITGGRRHGISVCADGTVNTWGSNVYGQLGRSSGTTDAPGKVNFGQEGIKILQVDGGSGYYNLAIDCNHNVWAWGQNSDGQIGNGSGGRTVAEVANNAQGGASVTIPVKVKKGEQIFADGADGSEFLTDVKYISAGYRTSYAIVGPHRALMAWGTNVGMNFGIGSGADAMVAGLLGNNNGVMPFSNTPVYVKTLDGQILRNVKQVDASYNGAIAVTTDGKVYSWGINPNSNLGTGNDFTVQKFSLCATPVKTGGYQSVGQFTGITGNLENIVQVAAGDEHSLAVNINGDVFVWGGDFFGQAGLTLGGNAKYAVNVQPGQSTAITGISNRLSGVTNISASMFGSAAVVTVPDGANTRGYLYTWGLDAVYPESGEAETNLNGQLGQGNTASTRQTFAQVRLPNLVDTFKLSNGTILRAKDVNVLYVSEGSGVFYVFTQDNLTLKSRIFAMGANNMRQLGMNGTTAVIYPTELPSLCELAEPCPVADLGGDRVICHYSALLLTNNFYKGSSYSYKWTYINEDGFASDVSLQANGPTLQATLAGKYILEVSRSVAGGCQACEPAVDTIQVKFEQPGFNDPGNLKFCENMALGVYVETGNPAGRYTWYSSPTSQTIIGRTTGEEMVDIDLSSVTIKEGQKEVSLWVADSSILKGRVAPETKLCKTGTANKTNLDLYSTQFTAYGNFRLNDFKVAIQNEVEMTDGLGGIKTFNIPVSVQLFSTRSEFGRLMADQVLATFTATLTVQKRGVYILTVPAGYNFSGTGEGKSYFFRVKNPVSSPVPLSGAFNTCTQDYSVLKDDIKGGGLAAITGTWDVGNNKINNYGYIFDFQIQSGVKTWCDRFPVVLTECVVTGVNAEQEVKTISVYPNPSSDVFTVKAAGFEKATLIDNSGKELDSFSTEKISLGGFNAGLYYLKVQTKDKTEMLKVVKQ